MLNETKIKSSKPRERPYKMTDSNGLFIEIKPNGAKVWRYRFRIDGKEKTFTIGDYPAVSLADARQRHQAARQQVKDGMNPVEERVKSRQKRMAQTDNTFAAMSEKWIIDTLSNKSESYIKQTRATLKNDVLPMIGHKSLDVITSADALQVIESTVARVRKNSSHGTGEAAAMVSKRVISGVFQYAIARLQATTDPTYAVRRVIQSPQTNHARALSSQEIRGLLYRIEGYQGRSVRDALAFMLLTMVRTKEARLAKWADIDFDQALWIVPAEIMKRRKAHYVPLSKQALDILERRKEFRDNDEFVFNSPQHRTKELSVTTINQALIYMGCENITGHDFRATASTVLNANGFSSDWIEKQLAHVESNAVRRSYNHADYLQDRRVMLQWWADYLDTLKTGQQQ